MRQRVAQVHKGHVAMRVGHLLVNNRRQVRRPVVIRDILGNALTVRLISAAFPAKTDLYGAVERLRRVIITIQIKGMNAADNRQISRRARLVERLIMTAVLVRMLADQQMKQL